MKLDKIDVKILTLLQSDARKSFREIAKELDSSAPTISSKIGILEESGVIKGYRAEIDADRLGEGSIILIVKSSPAELQNVAEKLKTLDDVTEVFIVSNSRIFLKVTLINPSEINNFLSNLSSIENILEYEYYSVIDSIKETPRAIVWENLSVVLKCYYCKKEFKDEPVKIRLDGKVHYLCCNTCTKHFKEKYEKLKNNIGDEPIVPHEHHEHHEHH